MPLPDFANLLAKIQYIRSNVLGMNLRNSEFIFKHNPLSLFRLVDNKILTKQALIDKSLPTPIMYFTVTSYFELKNLADRLSPFRSFVLKPANGFGGEGVMIVDGLNDKGYNVTGGQSISLLGLKDHIQDVMSGIYSLNQMPDHVLCEEKLEADPVLSDLTYKGIPDIRVVVFRGIPVMSMLRLSTQKSKGKANLHQGGIGAGIDMANGVTTHAIFSKNYIDRHPDSGATLVNATIPHWDAILELATRCYEAVPLGYMGVDIVLDPKRGPMVLEMNVRPGLMIQMANRMGLKPILEDLQKEYVSNLPVQERVAFGKRLYKKHRPAALDGALGPA